MQPDVSVAPELAQFIAPGPAPGAATPPQAGPAGPAGAGPFPTVGRLAAQLRLIAAAPDRWWELVRFDPSRPVRVAIPAERWCDAWLLILPGAGYAGQPDGSAGSGLDCRCEVATAVAGAAAEEPGGSPGAAAGPLVPGRVRVHGPGQAHRVVNLGAGYAVSMHARAHPHWRSHPQITL